MKWVLPAAVAASLLLAAAASADRTVTRRAAEVGTIVEAGPGEAIYSEDLRIPIPDPNQPFIAVLDAEMEVAKGITLPAGTRLSWHQPMRRGIAPPGAITDLEGFCSMRHVAGAGVLSMAMGGSLWKKFICLQDRKQDGKFNSIFLRGYKHPGRLIPAPYHKEAGPPSGHREFRAELLYQGFVGGVLRLAYREFTEDMIRASYSQEVSFEIAAGQPAEVSFKGARLRVLSADNNTIRAEVLQPFKW